MDTDDIGFAAANIQIKDPQSVRSFWKAAVAQRAKRPTWVSCSIFTIVIAKWRRYMGYTKISTRNTNKSLHIRFVRPTTRILPISSFSTGLNKWSSTKYPSMSTRQHWSCLMWQKTARISKSRQSRSSWKAGKRVSLSCRTRILVRENPSNHWNVA